VKVILRTNSLKTMKKPSLKQFLTDLSKMIGPGAIVRFALREKITLSAVSPTSAFFSPFPFEIKGPVDEVEDFQLPLENLLAAVSTETLRKPATLGLTESTLLVRTDRASIEFAVSPAPEVLTDPPKIEEVLSQFVLTEELHSFFKEVLPVLSLDKIHDAQADFRLYACFDEKVAFLAVYSSQQVCYLASSNEFKVKFEFNVPYPTFVTVHKSAPVGSELSFGEDRILISSGDTLLLSLVTPLTPKDPPGDLVRSKVREVSKSKHTGVLCVAKTFLESFLSSCKGIVPDDTPIVFTRNEERLYMAADTTTSKVKMRSPTSVEISGDLQEEFALELRLLKNIVQKSGEKLEMFYSDGVLLAKFGALGLITTTHIAR